MLVNSTLHFPLFFYFCISKLHLLTKNVHDQKRPISCQPLGKIGVGGRNRTVGTIERKEPLTGELNSGRTWVNWAPVTIEKEPWLWVTHLENWFFWNRGLRGVRQEGTTSQESVILNVCSVPHPNVHQLCSPCSVPYRSEESKFLQSLVLWLYSCGSKLLLFLHSSFRDMLD